MSNKDFSQISVKFFKNTTSVVSAVLLLVFILICFEVYIPENYNSNETITFTVEKGWSDKDISSSLQKLGIIRNKYFFSFYSIISLKHSSLQAGEYSLSPRMSIYDIVSKMAEGSVIKDEVVILEGWDINDIGKYLQGKGICSQNYFVALTKKDYSGKFSFLADKPKNLNLEGYLFPDTYEIGKGETCDDLVTAMLTNFDQKLTPAYRTEIKNQKKSIFNIVTMASLLEKEVRTSDDKKIVSGILWKRISAGMPLQLDCTVNYITGKNAASCSISDTKINSPYNTYMYTGLPKGPIANPGIDSITAAIYPTATNYWYYLTDGKTIFSETLAQQDAAQAKYLSH